MAWINRFWNLLHRDRLSRDLDEELQFHLDARTGANLQAGMSPEASQYDARKQFGNAVLAKERAREVNTLASLETLGQDLRYAIRSLGRSPGFLSIAVAAMALGTGANTAVFTVVNGVLLRSLPFPQPDRLFLISYKPQHTPFETGPGLADQHYLEFAKQNRAFESIATFGESGVTLTGAGDAVRLPAASVTSGFFRVLGVSPAMGRAFVPAEEKRASSVAVLSDQLWRSRFGGDRDILGKTITLDGGRATVIGVMPDGFAFPRNVELWLPLEVGGDPGNSYFRTVIGRLGPSVSLQQARAQFETVAQQLPLGAGANRSDMTAQVLPLKDLLVGNVRKLLLVFMGAVAFVLLIACANVANLLLMRGASRRQEIAVRSALGARRGRLIRQLLTESVMVSLTGAAAGILLAVVGVPALLALAPTGSVPRMEEIHIDGWVLAFALGLGGFTGIVFGLVPALQATGRELRDFLNQNSRTSAGRRDRVLSVMVVAEIALALVLLTGAGLMMKSFLRMRSVDPGFRSDHVLTLTVDLPESTYATATAMERFHERLLGKLSNVPGVLAAGAVNWLPLSPFLIRGDFGLDGGQRIPRDYLADKPAVSADYFRVMGISTLEGRGFTEQDNHDAPGVAVISRSVARTLWPGRDAVGKRLTLEDNPKPEDWLTIVGVVDDVRQAGMTAEPHAAIYQPYQQVTRPFFLSHMTFVVRTAADPVSVSAAMRQALAGVDRNQPVDSIAAMTDLVDATTAEPRFQARLISIFSLLALLLAALGIYGVLAYAVTERTREIGIRMALGAEKSDITRMVLKRSLLLATAGAAIGIAGALMVTRVLEKFLFDVKPTDPATFAVVAALLGAIALLAGWLPARRASAVDPLMALRSE